MSVMLVLNRVHEELASVAHRGIIEVSLVQATREAGSLNARQTEAARAQNLLSSN